MYPIAALVRFTCGWGGGGREQFQCKSESAQCSENQQSPCGAGCLKSEKKNAEKTSKSQSSLHLRKNEHRFPCLLYFFIHRQPNTISPARQQPRDWGYLFNFYESGPSGAQLLLITVVTTRLHGICNESNNGMEDGDTLQSHSLGTGDKCPPFDPKFPSFVWDCEWAQKCLILSEHTTGDFKSHHYEPRSHSQPYLCTHGHLSFSRIV